MSNTGTEAVVELEPLNEYNDDKDKRPLLPVANVPQHHGHSHKPLEQSEVIVIAMVVGFYWVCSMSVVFLNKYIFTYAKYEFPFPLFVTWYQLVVALVLLLIFGRFRVLKVVPPYEFKLDIAYKILPLTAIYVAMLTFNNLCLAFVEVSYYQVARSLTILFNIIFTYLILHTKTSVAAISACGVVFFGFVLGSYGESHFSFLGLFFGVCSSVFVALYGIFVKKKLQVVDNNEWRLLHYNTTLAILLLIPVVIFSGEIKEIKGVYFLTSPTFWTIMTVTGITGFLINIATFLQIKYTTPLTSTISGTAKACVQTVLSVIIFRNPITFTNAFGIILVLGGSLGYSLIRYYKI